MKFNDNIYIQRLDFDINLADGSKNRRVTYAALLKYEKVCLVDSGVVPTLGDLHKMIAEAGLSVKDIDFLLNTHCHFDHTGGNYDIVEENPDIKTMAHVDAKEFIENPEKQNEARPVPAYKQLVRQGVKVDHFLSDGDVLDIGSPVNVVHTPGHSVDSISFYLPEEKMIIAGDAIPLKGDLPIYDDLKALRASLRKLAGLNYRYIVTAFDGLYDSEKDGELKGDPIENALEYLDLIDQEIAHILKENDSISDEDIAVKLVENLGLPKKFPPFVYTSVKEHLKNLK